MNRTWIFTAAPIAFVAGLTMVHCSSSSSVTTAPPDGGHTGTGTGTGHAGSGSHPSSGTGTAPGSSTGTGTAGTGTGTGSGSDAGLPDGSMATIDAAGGDTDASCRPPEGGSPCTPGVVSCGKAADAALTCNVPTTQCCEGNASGVNACQDAGAVCPMGPTIQCNEAADCTGGKICCLLAMSTSPASTSVTCQAPVDGLCPGTGAALVQVCRSSAECASGVCAFWDCDGNTIEACYNPDQLDPGAGGTQNNSALCTKM
jgi:hypothetical protein